MSDIVKAVFRLRVFSHCWVIDNWSVVVAMAASARRVSMFVDMRRSLFDLVQQLNLVVSINWGVVVAVTAGARRVSMSVDVG